MYNHDTICAIATPYGEGGISIIRVSGDNAFSIVEKNFHGTSKGEKAESKNDKKGISDFKSHTLHHGAFKDVNERIVDEVLLGIFKSPNSYTGEDVIEINCHGGRIVTKKILDILLSSGARLAEPGEFTKRAFLNGRMDLSQAEAVADLISAKSEVAVKYSLNMLSGVFGAVLKRYQKELIEICGLIELELDFIEDDLSFVDRDIIRQKIEKLLDEISKMIDSYEIGRLFKDGIKVALIGKPNVGKSTILNSLLKTERAIVSNTPGTTRDFIEECMYENGVLFRLIDTAGLREPDNEIEKAGIEKTKEQLKLSDIIIYIFDILQKYNDSDWKYFREIITEYSKKSFVKIIIVFNKLDLTGKERISEFIAKNKSLLLLKNENMLLLSAKDFSSVQFLKDELIKVIKLSEINYDDSRLVTNIRHRNALQKASEKLHAALIALENFESGEFLSTHLRSALNSIGEIVGTVTTEDILNEIFSRFCIGK